MERSFFSSCLKVYRQGFLHINLVWILVLGFCFTCQLVSGQEEVEDTRVTVQTALGNVRGQRLQYKGLRGQTLTTVDKFLGIPFAEPPVGKLRFKRPQPHTGWTGTREATTVPPGCIGRSWKPTPSLAGLPKPPGGEMPPLGLGDSTMEMPPPLVGFPEPTEGEMPENINGGLPPSLDMGGAFGMVNPPAVPPAAGPPQGRLPSWLQGAVGGNPSSRRRRQAPPVPDLFLSDEIPPAEWVKETVGEGDNSTLSGDGPSQEEVISPRNGTTSEASTMGSIQTSENTTESSPAVPEGKTKPSVTVPPKVNDRLGDSTTPSAIIRGDPSKIGMTGIPPPVPPNQEGPFGTSRPNQEGPFGTSRPNQEGPFGTSRPNQEGPFGNKSPDQEGPFGRRGPSPEGPFGPRVATQGPFGARTPNEGGPFGITTATIPSTEDPFMWRPSQEGPFGNRSANGGPFQPGSQTWQDGSVPSPGAIPGVDIPLNMTGDSGADLDWNTFDWEGLYNNNDNRSDEDGLLYANPSNMYPRPPPMIPEPPVSTETSEDCLFLNVFVPENKNQTSSLPVMVFLHGGGFVAGHALNDDPTNLAIETDSIVVTTAYRLHVYGFFSLPNSQEYPGNLGLWDQVAALQWVQENIGYFGGDPQRVTLAGHSAGAMSVSMHVVSPASSGLFQGAYSMSGAKFHLNSGTTITRESSRRLLVGLQCDDPLHHDCIMNATQSIVDSYASSLDFKPVMDGQFFPKDPRSLVETNSYNKVPYLFGINSDEGLFIALMLFRAQGENAPHTAIAEALTRGILSDQISNFYDTTHSMSGSMEKIKDLVQKQYLWQSFTMEKTLRQVIDLASDVLIAPIKMMADKIADKQSEVYVYYFNHTPSATEALYENSLLIEVGAGHTEPLHLLFGRTDKQMSSYELELCEEYLSSLKSFLHTGKPSLPGVGDQVVDWPAYEKKTGNFVDFGWKGWEVTYKISSNFPVKTVSFWTDVLPAFVKDLEKTCPPLQPPMLGAHPHDDIVVKTSYGRVRGVLNKYMGDRDTWTGDHYQRFLGIQYAAPPTGERRWQDPVAPKRWQHIRQALTYPPSCPQTGERNQNENCLHLNVWVPARPDMITEKFPVLVYIHGGGFLTGNGNDPRLLNLGFQMNSIVVSVNFRLGALGFLSLGNHKYPGNYAHKDIIMALRWVQENIFNFGGNPCKVTLMGVDSGAALVSQIALSRYANGLVKNVMNIGGSATAPWANDLKPKETTKSFARKMGCPDGEESAMIECLIQMDAMALTSVKTLEGTTSVHGYVSPLTSYPWRPVMKDIKTWGDPLTPNINLRFLSGVTEHEGYQLFTAVVGNTSSKTRENFLEFLETFVKNDLRGSTSVYEALRTTYFPLDVLKDEGKFRNASIAFWTDWGYLAPLVEKYSKYGYVGYAYRMTYQSDNPIQPGLITHGEDFKILLSLFSPPDMKRMHTDPLIALILGIRLKEFIHQGMPDDPVSDVYWGDYNYARGFYTIRKDATFDSEVQLDSLTAARIHLWTVGIPEMLASLSCPSDTEKSNDNEGHDGVNMVHLDTPGQEGTDHLDTGGGTDSSGGPSALPVISKPGIVGLGLFESQIIMFALGGACVLFLLIIIILALFNCSLKRRLVGNKSRAGTVVFEEDLKYATKM